MALSLPQRSPRIDPTAWVAPGAIVVGDVDLGAEVSIWYSAVIRADAEAISVGDGSNIQDGSVLHADPGFPARIGRNVVVGHRAVLHGCTVEDGALIGIGSIVMNGAVIGAGSLVGAGALVSEGTVIPPGSLVLGAPGRVKRELSQAERDRILTNAEHYRALRTLHAQAQPSP